MKKAFNFRSVMVIALVLIMCLTAFVACDKNKGNDQPDTSGLKSARDYVKQTYINSSESTAEDYTLIAQVKIGDITYPIKWTVTITTEGAPADSVTLKEGDGKVTVDVNEQSTMDVAYTLTATVSDANGNSESVSFNRKVPKLQYADYATIKKACDESDKTTVYSFEGYIVGVNAAITSSYKSSSLGSMWVMDAQGHGLYVWNKYASNSTIDSTLTTREAINEKYPFGAKVIVKGTVVKSNGVYEFNPGSTVTLTGKTAQDDNVSLDYVDRTELYSGSTGMTDATTLLPVQSTLVELKGVVLGAKGDDDGVKNYHFTLNGKDFIFYKDTYLVDDTTLSAIDSKWAIGATANIKGLVNVFSNKYQVYPMNADAVTIVEEASDETVVDGVLSSLSLGSFIKENFTLPTNASVDSITWASNSANAVVDNATKLVTITRTNEDQKVTFTATVVKGEVSKTKAIDVTIKAADNFDSGLKGEAGVAYKLMSYQENLGKNLFITGEMNGYYFATTEDFASAIDVYVEVVSATDGTYRLYIQNGADATTKKYIEVIASGSYTNVKFQDQATEGVVWKWEEARKTYTIAVSGTDYVLGSYKTYTTVSASKASYDTTFVCQLCKEKEKTNQEKVDDALEALKKDFTVTAKASGTTFDLAATGINNATIVWTSSADTVIAIGALTEGKYVATVNDPTTDGMTVTLTAVLTVGEGEEAKTAQHEFPITVTRTLADVAVSRGEITGGTVEVFVSENKQTLPANLKQDNVITIVATASEGYKLVKVFVTPEGGEAVEVELKDAAYTYTLGAKNVTVTAEFELLPTSKVDGAEIKSFAELKALLDGGDTTNMYYTMGYIKTVSNATYGNATIEDFDGNTFEIFGMYDFAGTTKYESLTTKPVVGDFVVLYGALVKYGDTYEMKNARLAQLNDTVYAPTFAKRVEEAKAALTLKAEYGKNFDLVATGLNGTTITWTSSNTGLVSIAETAVDGKYLATVIVPDADTIVTLTATITLGTAQDTKEISVTIKANTKVTLTYGTSENGTFEVKANGEVVESGAQLDAFTTITVTVTPTEGYELASYTLGEGEADKSVAGQTSFTFDIVATTTLSVAFDKVQSVVATFTFATSSNTSAHVDGGTATGYTDTQGTYTLTIGTVTNFYTKANDKTGIGALKLGTSTKTGSFSVTGIQDDVKYVVFYVAGYKAKSTTVTIGGTNYAVNTLSDNGEYTAIKVAVSDTKTISFVSGTSGDKRCLISKIEFIA